MHFFDRQKTTRYYKDMRTNLNIMATIWTWSHLNTFYLMAYPYQWPQIPDIHGPGCLAFSELAHHWGNPHAPHLKFTSTFNMAAVWIDHRAISKRDMVFTIKTLYVSVVMLTRGGGRNTTSEEHYCPLSHAKCLLSASFCSVGVGSRASSVVWLLLSIHGMSVQVPRNCLYI